MLGSAAVGATGAGWLLAVLTLGLARCLSAEEDPGFSLCDHSFYRQTPPVGLSSGETLSPLCHSLPGGQAFATLYISTCDTAVCSAVHLRPGWGEREAVEEEGEAELGKDKEEDESSEESVEDEGGQKVVPQPPVGTPALLLRNWGESSDSPLHSWDSLVSKLLRDIALPQCSSAGGDLYVLTGAGGARSGETGDEGCKPGGFWSAACCTGPQGASGFSVGLVREMEGGERVVSVKELGESIGVTELFSGGCEGTDGEIGGVIATLLVEALAKSVENQRDKRLDITDEDVTEATGSSIEAPSTGEEQVAVDTTVEQVDTNIEEQGDMAPVSSELLQSSDENVSSEPVLSSDDYVSPEALRSSDDNVSSEPVLSSDDYVSPEALRSPDDNETLASAESDTESGLGTLVYIISSSVSLLTAPFRPIVSTITEIPGQVTYVLQEDLGVLTAIPGDTLSLFQLISSDLGSGLGSAKDLLVGLGEMGFSGLYSCASRMVETLLSSCQTGVTGMGTLAGDGVGILEWIADNVWSLTSFFGGRLWEQSEGYVRAVGSEIGVQVQAVGGGLGELVCLGGNGVGNVVSMVWGLVAGSVEMVVGVVNEAYVVISG